MKVGGDWEEVGNQWEVGNRVVRMNMTDIFGTNVLKYHNEVHYTVQWIWASEQVDSERPKTSEKTLLTQRKNH